MLEVGKPFPFALPNQTGQPFDSEISHAMVSGYFYPKMTLWMHNQGKSFTASSATLSCRYRVVGVSQDDAESHKKFCSKFAFTVDLLADTNGPDQACGIGQSECKGSSIGIDQL